MLYAEEAQADKILLPDVQILIRSVKLRHDSMYMYCDSALIFEKTNSVEAFSNVRMEQGDTLFIYGDYLYYDGMTQIAQLRENVKMINRNTTLLTDSLNYDRVYNLGYFFDGGTLMDEQNVLTSEWGEYNPGVRLPVTFYKDVNQLPDFEDYSMKGRTYRYMQQQPLFPFGHGLSYTTFTYGEAKLSKNTIAKGENVVLTIPVSNVGQRDGEEVVQVYLRRPGDKEGPRYTLRAFKRVHIPAGKTESVAIPLTGENFEWFDVESNTMRPLEGTYELLYGGTSDRNKLKTIVMNVQ